MLGAEFVSMAAQVVLVNTTMTAERYRDVVIEPLNCIICRCIYCARMVMETSEHLAINIIEWPAQITRYELHRV